MPSVAERIVADCDDAVIYADRDGIIVLFNGAAERMFGYPGGQAVGNSLDLIIPEKHRMKHWRGYHRVMESGVISYTGSLLAVPAVRADGSRISVEFTVAVLRDEHDRVEGIAAILRDVTDQRNAHQALARELATLRRTVDSGPARSDDCP